MRFKKYLEKGSSLFTFIRESIIYQESWQTPHLLERKVLLVQLKSESCFNT